MGKLLNKINTEFYTLALSIGIIIGLIIIRHILVLNENKKLYEQLESSHDELEIRVKQRTEDLANINLELKNEIIEREKTDLKTKNLSWVLLGISANVKKLKKN